MRDQFETVRFFSLLVLSLTAALVITMFLINAGSLPGWVVLTALGALLGTFMTHLAYQRPPDATLADLHSEAVNKRKNSAADSDPMNLLTDDDIEELRAEFKDELRRRYLQGLDEDGASEPISFEALLEDRQRKRR